MANPVLTVDASTFYNTTGYVRLTWTNANKGVDWYSWRVYRRPTGGSWTLLKEYLVDQASYEYRDYTAASNTSQEWVVVRVYLVSGTPTEEAKTGGITATPVSDGYYLVHPFDEAGTVRLYHVTDDSFEDEHAMAELEIIGRGRKVDQGTQWGLKGTLAAQLRDRSGGPTARTQLQGIRAAKKSGTFFWLRNPWGDVIRVAIGNVGVDRIAGIGASREFVDIDFNYTEVVV